MQKQNSKKQGFTLAEILITLTVIGVVAALTIPTLLQNTNQAELKAGLKRTYADLSQATNMIVNDKGGTLVNAFKYDTGGLKDSENLKNAFRDKLSYIKDCSGDSSYGGTGNGVGAEGCWHSTNNWKELNGTPVYTYTTPGLILSNGTLVFFKNESSGCTLNLSAYGATYTRCAYIDIDVNGFKQPNTMGKDIFEFSLTANSLIPAGAQGFFTPETTCIEESTAAGNRGHGCTALYLYQ